MRQQFKSRAQELSEDQRPDRRHRAGGDDARDEPQQSFSVEWLQESLNELGTSPVLAVDGDYGEQTKAAVAEYQEEHPPLVVDGWAGVATQASIYEELAKL